MDHHDVRPLLIYQVSGGNLCGFLHLQLVVMSDGQATLMCLDPVTNPQGVIALRMLCKQECMQLVCDLACAGVMRICDDSMVVYDAPLTTVVAFDDAGHSNSFSYYSVVLGAEWAPVECIVQDLLATHFGETTPGGPGVYADANARRHGEQPPDHDVYRDLNAQPHPGDVVTALNPPAECSHPSKLSTRSGKTAQAAQSTFPWT